MKCFASKPFSLLKLLTQELKEEVPLLRKPATDSATPAPAAKVGRLAANLQARNYEVVVVQTGAQAKAEVLKRIPDGTRIHSGKSKTLEDIGLFGTLMGSDEYDFVRKQTVKMD